MAKLLVIIFDNPTSDSIYNVKFTRDEIKGVCERDDLWELVSKYVDKEELGLLHYNEKTGVIYNDIFGTNYGVALKLKFKGDIDYV